VIVEVIGDVERLTATWPECRRIGHVAVAVAVKVKRSRRRLRLRIARFLG
jgi:hypothetical protein